MRLLPTAFVAGVLATSAIAKPDVTKREIPKPVIAKMR